jgi:hypothetical protein
VPAFLPKEIFMTEATRPATWRVVLAFILDLVTGFVVIGYAIALVTGDTTENGFQLNGLPALLFFALLIAYMALMPRYGGRPWQRILKAR